MCVCVCVFCTAVWQDCRRISQVGLLFFCMSKRRVAVFNLYGRIQDESDNVVHGLMQKYSVKPNKMNNLVCAHNTSY